MHQRLVIRAAGFALLVVLAGAGGGVQAQAVHAGGAVGAGAATRSVSRYLALERELDEALAARDDAVLNARVDPQFEYRAAASPEVLGSEEWQRHVPHPRSRIRDLTVREDGEIAVVGFLADASGKTRFVVDVWKGDTLLSRHSSVAVRAPRAAKRPSGRE